MLIRRGSFWNMAIARIIALWACGAPIAGIAYSQSTLPQSGEQISRSHVGDVPRALSC